MQIQPFWVLRHRMLGVAVAQRSGSAGGGTLFVGATGVCRHRCHDTADQDRAASGPVASGRLLPSGDACLLNATDRDLLVTDIGRRWALWTPVASWLGRDRREMRLDYRDRHAGDSAQG